MLEIATTLAEEHDVTLLTTGTIDKTALEKFLGRSLANISILPFRDHPSAVARLLDRVLSRRSEGNVYKKMFTTMFGPRLVQDFDLFVNGESGDFIRNTAPKGLFMIFFPWGKWGTWPPRNLLHRLYRIPYNVWRRYFYGDRWETYQSLCAISDYSRRYVEDWLHRPCGVLYPPIDDAFVPLPKFNRIVMLGRFMPGDAKGQLFGIEQFKLLANELAGWELVCAGSVWARKDCEAFFDRLTAAAYGLPVRLLPNLPFADLVTLVGQSKIFWHTMGYGEDLVAQPQRAEHFGMPTVECMRAGCIPIGFNGGGQRELITHGTNGFLWREPLELRKSTLRLASDHELWKTMSSAAINRGADFSRECFREQLLAQLPR
jgi:glycosyltransferase involved in cell wall biosynthesis